MMPVMNGGELIARLRAEPATGAIPVLLVSASINPETVPEADAFLRKPFQPAAARARAVAARIGGLRWSESAPATRGST